jgi:hypothetical protein
VPNAAAAYPTHPPPITDIVDDPQAFDVFLATLAYGCAGGVKEEVYAKPLSLGDVEVSCIVAVEQDLTLELFAG